MRANLADPSHAFEIWSELFVRVITGKCPVFNMYFAQTEARKSKEIVPDIKGKLGSDLLQFFVWRTMRLSYTNFISTNLNYRVAPLLLSDISPSAVSTRNIWWQ